VVKSLLTAFSKQDRDTAERLIAPEFHLTSLFDYRTDRAAYCTISWPNSGKITFFKIEHLIEEGSKVAVTYVGGASDGKRFQNTEIMACRAHQVVEVEVYFDWSVPHAVAPGSHSDPS
jgi:ketosteroid isomerase-like protein